MNKFTADEIEEFRVAFDQFDDDHSGSIDVGELNVALVELGVEVSTAELQALVEKVDQNGTGELDFSEFVELIAQFQTNGDDSSSDDDEDLLAELAAEEASSQKFKKSANRLNMIALQGWTADELVERLETLRLTRQTLMDTLEAGEQHGAVGGGAPSGATDESEHHVSEPERRAVEAATTTLTECGFHVFSFAAVAAAKAAVQAKAAEDDHGGGGFGDRDQAGGAATTTNSTLDEEMAAAGLAAEELPVSSSVDILQFIDVYMAQINQRLSSVVQFIEVLPNLQDSNDEAGRRGGGSGKLTEVNQAMIDRDLLELEAFQFEEEMDPALKQGVDAFKDKAKEFPFFMFPIDSVCDRIAGVDHQFEEYESLINGKEFVTKPKCPHGAKCHQQDNLEHRLQYTHPCYAKEIPCPHRHREMHMRCYSHEPIEVPGQSLQESKIKDLQKVLGLLDVSGMEMGDPGAECIAHVLAKDRRITRDPSKLKYRDLRIGGNHISPLGGIPLLENCLSLVSIDLSGNGLGYKGALLVNSGVGSALENLLKKAENLLSLNLARNGLGDRDAHHICSGLKQNTTLRHLDLRKNELGPQFGMDMAGALSENRELKELLVGWNRLESSGSAALLDELRNDNSREVVDLSWTGVNDNGAKCVGELIAGSSALRALNVSHNAIGRVGAGFIGKSLTQNRTLQILDLSFNPLGERSACELVRDLRENTTLELLDLRCVKADEQTAREIRDTMKHREKRMPNSSILFSTSVAATQQQQQKKH